MNYMRIIFIAQQLLNNSELTQANISPCLLLMQLNIEVACVLFCGPCFVINRSRRLVHPRGGSKPPQTGDPGRLVLLAWTPMCWRSASKQLLCGSPGGFAAGPRFQGITSYYIFLLAVVLLFFVSYSYGQFSIYGFFIFGATPLFLAGIYSVFVCSLCLKS